MKIRGHGNGIAIALAALAVVLAGTGTAMAVSATVVHIEDGYTAGRFAHVDSSGHLSTNGATSTINIETIAQPNSTYQLTDPTTATLAVTRLALFNPQANTAFANNTYVFQLIKTNVGAAGHCYDSDSSVAATYSSTEVSPGDTVENVFPAPLYVKASPGKKYCLSLAGYQYGTTTTSYYVGRLELSAYVVTGSYSGTGSILNPSRTPVSHRVVKASR